MGRAAGLALVAVVISVPADGQPWDSASGGRAEAELTAARREAADLDRRVRRLESHIDHVPVRMPLEGIDPEALLPKPLGQSSLAVAAEAELVQDITATVPRTSLDAGGLATVKPQDTGKLPSLAALIVALGVTAVLLSAIGNIRNRKRMRGAKAS